MKNYLAITLLLLSSLTFAQHDHGNIPMHQMQHGFILSNKDSLGSHLVASGHHSRQVEIEVLLEIDDAAEKHIYQERKDANKENQSYFLFQAQQLDLPSLKEGQILNGPIVESKMGSYEPKNIIVKNARLTIKKVLLNIENPFFKDE